jgi:hypothetical protein
VSLTDDLDYRDGSDDRPVLFPDVVVQSGLASNWASSLLTSATADR